MHHGELYFFGSLSTVGFALVGPIVYELRPDLWSTGSQAGRDVYRAAHSSAARSMPGLKWGRATLHGRHDLGVLIVYRLADGLAERVKIATGYELRDLRDSEPPWVLSAAAALADAEQQKIASSEAHMERQRLERLLTLAEDALPSHTCAARAAILEARKELDRRGVAYQPAG